MSHRVPNSLNSRCLRVVLDSPEPVTIVQVITRVGRHISTATAVRRGKAYILKQSRRRGVRGKTRGANPDNPLYTVRRLAEIGRREMVTSALRELTVRELIQRVRPGLYAAPAPKLYPVGEEAMEDEPNKEDLGNQRAV